MQKIGKPGRHLIHPRTIREHDEDFINQFFDAKRQERHWRKTWLSRKEMIKQVGLTEPDELLDLEPDKG